MRRTRYNRTFIRKRSLPFVKAIRNNGTKRKERPTFFFLFARRIYELKEKGNNKNTEKKQPRGRKNRLIVSVRHEKVLPL
ncbi:hypothetical protein POVCU2_0066880 [Plasmodium ovale curtisi]|uniref:Uncharacterized protein n=1 Tax=Plasmodium ovale curtisi TaxID=864141 RepID=A0A1A8WGX1_PLAOA|nr:hypothetical protein POVCU1_000480 [Plasmodium ovale curtisi]SBS91324.1 hypothetical protein POVCU2_0066880 [Plasmodium ovale curtisi]